MFTSKHEHELKLFVYCSFFNLFMIYVCVCHTYVLCQLAEQVNILFIRSLSLLSTRSF